MGYLFNKNVYFLFLPLLLSTTLGLTSPAWAGELERTLKNRVYPNGGTLLYCRSTFTSRDRIKTDQVYAEKKILEHFDCITSRQCSSKPQFKAAAEDLHNIFPTERKSSYDRRGTRYGEIPDNMPFASDSCRYQVSFQTFEPPDEAKGDIARAMFYMHEQYGLPIIGDIGLFLEWNVQDPVSAEERKRNNLIRNIQGNSNPFIDNPSRANKFGGVRTNFQ